MSTIDWSLGSYEHTAEQLAPAARVVVESAAPAGNEDPTAFGVTSRYVVATARRA